MALYQSGSGLSALVGIGTTNPSYQFHVSNVSTTSSTSAAFLTPSLGTSGVGNFIQVGTAISTYQSASLGFLNYGTNTSNVCQISINGVGGSAINIISSGVGIGTTSLGGGQGKLFVANDVTLTSGNYAGDVAAQIMAVGSANPLKRLALMYDTNNNIGLVQAMIAGTGTSPLILNGAGGNVGIGTTNPTKLLQVWGGMIIGASSDSRATTVTLNAPGATTTFSQNADIGDGARIMCLQCPDLSSTTANLVSFSLQVAPTGTFGTQRTSIDLKGFRVANQSYGGFCLTSPFDTGGSYDLFYADRTKAYFQQNVGIGTASPGAPLHVYKGTDYGEIFVQRGSGQVASLLTGGAGCQLGYSGYLVFGTITGAQSAGFTEYMRITSSGYVGIATASPLARFTIKNSYNDGAAGGLCLDATDGAVYNVRFYSYVQAGSQVAYKWVVNNVASSLTAMTFGYNGFVGMGTDNPQYKHHVTNGDTSMTLYGPNSTWSAYLVTGAGTSQVASGKAQMITTNGNLHIDCGTGQSLYLNYYTGGAGVGGTIVSWGPWTHTGNFTATGNIASSSDRRIKTDLEIIPDALDKIKKINGYTFTRTDNGSIGRQAGVIAQEVKDVLPEVIHENQDGMYSVSYGNLIALLIEGLKEETRKREELEKLLLNRM